MTTETKTIPINLNREYTAEEFVALEDDGNRYELIEGKLVMTPATGDEHGTIAGRLYLFIQLFLMTNQIGKVWFTTGFYIGKKPNGKDNVPEPDLGFIVASRVPPVADKYLPYPDLAVEIWSRKSDLDSPASLTKAREKLQMYLNAGTRLAWGINPITQTIEIYRQGQTAPAQVLTIDDELFGEDVMPGFQVKVRGLFE